MVALWYNLIEWIPYLRHALFHTLLTLLSRYVQRTKLNVIIYLYESWRKKAPQIILLLPQVLDKGFDAECTVYTSNNYKYTIAVTKHFRPYIRVGTTRANKNLRSCRSVPHTEALSGRRTQTKLGILRGTGAPIVEQIYYYYIMLFGSEISIITNIIPLKYRFLKLKCFWNGPELRFQQQFVEGPSTHYILIININSLC